MNRDIITLPASWASALINDDYSGLDDQCPTEAARCRARVDQIAADGWSIVSDVEDSERFTWYYRLYDPGADCDGGNVIDYVILRPGR
jgi:hypothetical protein